MITGVSPFLQQFAEVLFHVNRNAVIAQFRQHIAAAFDGVTCGKEHRILQILVGKMEVAAQAKRRRWTDPLPQKIQRSSEEFAIVVVAVVGMWSGDNMLDTICGCHAAHFFSDVPGFGAVIYFRENVAVNVDQFKFLKILTELV